MVTYEFVYPVERVDLLLRRAAHDMFEFCLRDLDLSVRPRLEWIVECYNKPYGPQRQYFGETITQYRQVLGIAQHHKNRILINAEIKDIRQIQETVAHEVRHFWQKFSNAKSDREYDAECYAHAAVEAFTARFDNQKYKRSQVYKPQSPKRFILEHRSFPLQTFEKRMAVEGRKISGYAAKFNSESLDLGGFTEVLKPGCFARSLARQDNDIALLVDHNTFNVLGRRSASNLVLKEDGIGLYFECGPLPDTNLARDTLENLNVGLLKNMSFGFWVIKDRWVGKTREVLEAEIQEISIVTFPAYPASSAAVV